MNTSAFDTNWKNAPTAYMYFKFYSIMVAVLGYDHGRDIVDKAFISQGVVSAMLFGCFGTYLYKKLRSLRSHKQVKK